MTTKSNLCTAAAVAITGLVLSPTVAVANPSTPMTVIESSAAQLCGAIDANPTEDGVYGGMMTLDSNKLDEMDVALVLITAVHHVCPQHEALVMGALDAIPAEEPCSKQT
jgi:hypothetical protein